MISENCIYFIIYSDQDNQRCGKTTPDIHKVSTTLIINISQCLVTLQPEDENVGLPGISVLFSNQFPAARYLDTG